MTEISIREMAVDEFEDHLEALSIILHQTVEAGASVGFVHPFTLAESRHYWTNSICPAFSKGNRVILIAKSNEIVVGTVQLDLDVMPNQRHRGEVSKLLVHPDYRNLGIGRKLMQALQERAAGLQKTLLTLDTRTGDVAEPLYQSLGYQIAGIIPGFCRDPEEEKYDATTYMFKDLSSDEG